MAIEAYSNGEYIKTDKFLAEAQIRSVIAATGNEPVHQVLIGLMQKGLIVVTQYGAVLGEVASDEFNSFRLSKEGLLLAELVK